MQILAIERPLAPIDPHRHHELLRTEAACVWALKKAELVRDIWFTRQDRRAVLMLECASEEDARRHLASLPLVRAELITFEVLSLRSYDGFDRLVAGLEKSAAPGDEGMGKKRLGQQIRPGARRNVRRRRKPPL